MKRYGAHGLAGCVEQKRCRATGLPIGIYRADQAELEDDPEFPWATVCEEHGTILRAQTLKLARAGATHPEWCDDCQPLLERA